MKLATSFKLPKLYFHLCKKYFDCVTWLLSIDSKRFSYPFRNRFIQCSNI